MIQFLEVKNNWLRTINSFASDKQKIKKLTPLTFLLTLATFIFIFGWYFDPSTPRGGVGWADQDLYTSTVNTLRNGDLPTEGQLHYAIGYPLLGLIGSVFQPSDPFVLVSYALFIGSLVFCFLSAVHIFKSTYWAVLFCLLLLFWDGAARTFNYVPELFMVPWNNQVLFFAMAYFLWLFTTGKYKKLTLRIIIATSIVGGISILTREETILFIGPTILAFLLLAKTTWKNWLIAGAIVSACVAPQIVVKQLVLGSISTSGRKYSYGQFGDRYLQPSLLYRNSKETILNSERYSPNDPERSALLQAAPWLWLAPAGFLIIFISKRYDKGLKIFMVISLSVLIFYLSGSNMSGHKLKFHCLRYISPAFIALNLSAVLAAREIIGWGSKSTTFNKIRNKRA